MTPAKWKQCLLYTDQYSAEFRVVSKFMPDQVIGIENLGKAWFYAINTISNINTYINTSIATIW